MARALTVRCASVDSRSGRRTARSSGSTRGWRRLPSLRSWRIAAGLTQSELASRASIARETLIRVKQGRPAKANLVVRLAATLNIDTDPLLNGVAPVVQPRITPSSTFLLPGLRHGREVSGVNTSKAGITNQPRPRNHCTLGTRSPRAGRRGQTSGAALVVAPSMLTRDETLNDPNRAVYRVCTECRALRPTTGFIRIKGPNGFYGRCRICRGNRARERYRSRMIVMAALLRPEPTGVHRRCQLGYIRKMRPERTVSNAWRAEHGEPRRDFSGRRPSPRHFLTR